MRASPTVPACATRTLGPGATNLVTALVESLNAGIPQIAIVGDANRDHAWKNMTQEARQIEILRPAVKELIRVEATKRIPELVRRAFAVATSGRPGPVVLDVPEDVCHGEHDFDAADFWVDEGTLKAQARRTRPDPRRGRARRGASSPRPSARCCWSAAASTSRKATTRCSRSPKASASRSPTRCPARARSPARIRSRPACSAAIRASPTT